MWIFLYVLPLVGLIGSLFYAAYSDARGMRIPNECSLVVLAGFGMLVGLDYLRDVSIIGDVIMGHIMPGLVIFALTYAMFALKKLGGGDAKLLSAVTLWVGWAGLPSLLIIMSLAGGVLAIMALVLQRMKPLEKAPTESWIYNVQHGEAVVPYGIAITAGSLYSVWYLGFFSEAVFQSLLSGGVS